MKKSIILLSLLSLSISCKEGSKDTLSNNTALSSKDINIKIKAINQEASSYVTRFITCKSTATKRSHCRNTITEAISTIYNVNDFKNPKGNFKIYDSIHPIIKRSKKWMNIGAATTQSNINKAIEHVNNGKLALIIDTAESYGHVVVVQPGKVTKSGSWGLKLPNVLSLLSYKPEKSFQNKSLAHAIKKNVNLQIYIRE